MMLATNDDRSWKTNRRAEGGVHPPCSIADVLPDGTPVWDFDENAPEA